MRAFVAVLEDLDVEIIEARDGRLAIRLAKESMPGLILMDIHLPVLSGLDAAKQIKSDPKLASIPIVALTAMAMRGDREKILAAGCDDYISKPVDPARLKEIVIKWMKPGQ